MVGYYCASKLIAIQLGGDVRISCTTGDNQWTHRVTSKTAGNHNIYQY